MKLAIMQPYLFPYFGYFELIAKTDKFVILDDVNYIKKGWINRNRILINNNPFMFTLPIKQLSQNKRINEIEIIDSLNFSKKLLRTLEQNYKKSPFFNDFFSVLVSVLNYRETNLNLYVVNAIAGISKYLGMPFNYIFASALQAPYLIGTHRIIDICKQLNATEYINLPGGKGLYSEREFSSHKIKISFINGEPYVYQNFSSEFIPNLSIIDLLMFNPPQEVRLSLLRRPLGE